MPLLSEKLHYSCNNNSGCYWAKRHTGLKQHSDQGLRVTWKILEKYILSRGLNVQQRRGVFSNDLVLCVSVCVPPLSRLIFFIFNGRSCRGFGQMSSEGHLGRFQGTFIFLSNTKILQNNDFIHFCYTFRPCKRLTDQA